MPVLEDLPRALLHEAVNNSLTAISRLLFILLAACLLVVVSADHTTEAEAESSGSGDGAQRRESLFDLVNGQSIVECYQCLTDRYLHHEDGMSSYGCETLRRTALTETSASREATES